MSVISLKYKSKSGNLTAPGDVDPGAFIPIATTTLTTSTATISFTGIPQNYEHLQIRGILRSDRAGQPKDQLRMQLNSDTGSNYTTHLLSGDGTAAYAAANVGATFINNNSVTGATSTASMYGTVVMDILDYANTNKYTVVRFLSGYDTSGAGTVELDSGVWLNTAAVTSISIVTIGNMIQYSQLALYGIKRAGA